MLKSSVNNIKNQFNILQKDARDGWNDMQYNMGRMSSFEHAMNNIKYGITDTVEVLGNISEAFFEYLDANSN